MHLKHRFSKKIKLKLLRLPRNGIKNKGLPADILAKRHSVSTMSMCSRNILNVNNDYRICFVFTAEKSILSFQVDTYYAVSTMNYLTQNAQLIKLIWYKLSVTEIPCIQIN